jgi:hypothetical protein
MNFFLTPGRKDETVFRSAPPEDRKVTFANEMAAYRKATGKNEIRLIPCRCAVTGRPFTLQFERVSPAHRFQIARIEAGTEGGGERRLARSPFARAPERHCYEVADFDWAGCVCPHCRASGTINCESCRETVCGGRRRTLPTGGRAFACHDDCGATGEIGPATQIQGTTASRPGLLGRTPAMKALPRPQAQKALPGSKWLRLTGPKR